MDAYRHLRLILGYLGTLGGLALVTLVMFEVGSDFAPNSISLMYLLAIFSCALVWGMGPAVVGSVAAAAAFDYFFLPPIFALGVTSRSQAVVLIAFLVVTIVTSRLATHARAQAREAQLRARESRALFRLSEAVAGAQSADAALEVITEHVVEIFGVRSCAILLPDAAGALRVQVCFPADVPSTLTRDEEEVAAHASRHHTLIPHQSVLYIPVRVGSDRLGVLRIGPRHDGHPLPSSEHRLLETFAAAAAVAIDRRRLQEGATQAEVLRRSDELKSALLNSVSHDLRTPLTTIKTGITALLEDDMVWEGAARHEMLAAANEEVDRLTRLITNLLDLSRIEAGALRPDRQWYEIGELVRGVVQRVAGRLPAHAVTVEIADDALPVFVDYVQIQAVITNLVDNAALYSAPGTAILVTVGAEGGALVIRVRDQGPGIPAAEAERIFSKFYRLGRHARGTGLGLAICRGFVEAHGGRIWVENPGHSGAILAVSLPLVTAPVLAGAPS